MKLYAVFSEYSERSENKYSDEPYDYSWEEDVTCILEAVSLRNESNDFSISCREFDVDADLKEGDSVFVVTVTYSTGDTFGHSTGNMEVEGIYTNAKEAKDIADLIENDTGDADNYRKAKDYYPVWSGYFESVSDVRVHTVKIVSEYS